MRMPRNEQRGAAMTSEIRSSVLIVEHHPAVRTALARVFASQGWTGIGSANLREAARNHRRYRSELKAVVVDLDVGEESGLAFVSHLRRRSPLLPVIVFTGSNDQGELDAALAMGVSACLPKPTPPERIVEAVRHAIAETVSDDSLTSGGGGVSSRGHEVTSLQLRSSRPANHQRRNIT
jgi:DNA-binding NarL/FixJ family response regulator